MTHYVYFVGHPNLRARLNWKDEDTGATAWVVEFRPHWLSSLWQDVSSIQMPLDEIEDRIYSGDYQELDA